MSEWTRDGVLLEQQVHCLSVLKGRKEAEALSLRVLPASRTAELEQTSGPAGSASSGGMTGPDTHLALASQKGPDSLFASLPVARVSVGATKLLGSAGGRDPLSTLLIPWVPCSSPAPDKQGLSDPWSRQQAAPWRTRPTSPTLTNMCPSWLDAHIRCPTHIGALHGRTCQHGDRQRWAEGEQAAYVGAGANKGGTGHCPLSQIG